MDREHLDGMTASHQEYHITNGSDYKRHEHDPVTKVVFALGGIAIVLAGSLVNDTIRQKVAQATAKEVKICSGDTLRNTRDEQPHQPEISVELAGGAQCVTMTVPCIASIEASATTIDGHSKAIQSIAPEYLTQSGYLSDETLTALKGIMSTGNGIIWIDPVGAPRDE